MTRTTCPRCDRPVIEIKDWGKAGRLYVHRHHVENGLPVQEACHVHAEELLQGLNWTWQSEGIGRKVK